MPPRKRKINPTDEEMMPPPQLPAPKKQKQSKLASMNLSVISDISNTSTNTVLSQSTHFVCGALSVIFEKAQENEALHNKYFKELTQIYEKMEHDQFMAHFLRGIRIWMKKDESHRYANIGLEFLAKYLSSLRCDDPDVITHPILKSTFEYLLKTISLQINVRFRICQFVNMLLASMSSEANIDDDIFDEILKYMSERMKDLSPTVRVQAVYALQRLQIPENPDDCVVRIYSYHLSNDPSAHVRQAVLKSIGRNALTVPIILERLWDVDDRVRRRTYLQMSSHPVKSYKVAQRLQLLEQGLNDHSEPVRKITHSVLLPQWLQSYNKQYLSLISALKLDANQEELQRFVKITKKALFSLFKNDSIDELLSQLPLSNTGDYTKCIPFEKLTVEMVVYWLSMVEYIQETDANEEDEDEQLLQVICELSTFCEYLTKYINYIRESASDDPESWETQENQYKLHLLIEILLRFDLGDEIGRQNLNTFVSKVLSSQLLGENIIKKLVHCVENLITDLDARLQYFIDIIRSIIDPSSSIDVSDPSIAALLESITDPETKVKIGHLKLQIMDLREQEIELTKNRNFARLDSVTEELAGCNEEFVSLLSTYSDSTATLPATSELTTLNSKKVSKEWNLHCLEIFFFAVCSKQTTALNPNMFKLYEDFVQRHMKSQHMEIRDRALKCGITCSMLYEHLAKDVHEELYQQFVRHHQPRLWTTAVNGICEMFDRYGIDFFTIDLDAEKPDGSKTKKTRQLYNATLEQDEAEESSESGKNSTNVMYLFAHLFDTCQEASISMALATGFCRLILGGHYETNEIMSKILLKFFTPTTCTEISQILSVFFETLIQRRKQIVLQKALLPTIFTILDAPHESPLREIKPDHVIKFVINSTVQTATDTNAHIHTEVARTFLQRMVEQLSNKDVLKLLSKELQTLDISTEQSVRDELKELAHKLLAESINDSKIEGYIKVFIEMLSGNLSKRDNAAGNGDEYCSDEDGANNENDFAADATKRDQTISDATPKDTNEAAEDAADDAVEDVLDKSAVSSVESKDGDEEKVAEISSSLEISKEINESDQVVTSTQKEAADDDEVIPTTPKTPAKSSRNIRKAATKKVKANADSERKTPDARAAKKQDTESSAEKRKRHRLSQAHVRLERINLPTEETPHRTRSALVAEFKEKNIMTRKRHSLDNIKSTTQRVEHLKKIAPNALQQQNKNRLSATSATKSTTSRRSSSSSSSSSTASTPAQKKAATTAPRSSTAKQSKENLTASNALKRGRSEIKQTTKETSPKASAGRGASSISRNTTPNSKSNTNASLTSSPGDTPVAKRRSITNGSPSVSAPQKNSASKRAPAAAEDQNASDDRPPVPIAKVATRSKIPTKIPTRLALSRSTTSIKQATQPSKRIQSSASAMHSSLPLRKSNRSAFGNNSKKK